MFESHLTIIFSDGACSHNPGPGGWGTVIATPDRNILEMGGREDYTTNNRMEIKAAYEALVWINQNPNPTASMVSVCTDSSYLIKGITAWIWQWEKDSFKTRSGTDVANVEEWTQLQAVVRSLKEKKITVEWKHIKGHSGVPANERVDQIAVDFSRGLVPCLYHGPLESYSIDVHESYSKAKKIENTQNKGLVPKPAVYYLSLVNGQVSKHQSWSACEQRVKGISGAKFQKVRDLGEEAEILKKWGLKA